MRTLKKLYHFLGSIYFAVILIGSVALFTIAGTFIESLTQSHRYAALFTYNNPVFKLLLWGFFVNILFSSLRRYPFRKGHIPFLITHFGLLMILSGCLIKSYFGTQGTMIVTEGSGCETIYLSDTYALYIESRNGETEICDPFNPVSNLSIRCIDYTPNGSENIESWIQGNTVFISGLPPFPIEKPVKVRLFPEPSPLWTVMGKKEVDLEAEYADGLQATLIEKTTGKVISQGEISEIPKGTELILSREPKLIVLPDGVYALGPNGGQKRIENTPSLIAYDKGFGGYSTFAKLTYERSIQKKREEVRQILIEEIRSGDPSTLSPPLKLLWDACAKTGTDFAKTCVDYLTYWDNTESFLFPNHTPLPPPLAHSVNQINWKSVPPAIRKGCIWTCRLFDDIEPKLSRGDDPKQVLIERGYPIPKEEDVLTGVTRQIFSAGDELPDGTPPDSARLLSAYMRVYGIHLSTIAPEIQTESEEIILESPMKVGYKKVPPTKKLEENTPGITLEIENERIALTYQQMGNGLKWPILNGKYLVRFQPKTETIPYRVRLRNARQISYPNSSQALAYESDLIVTNLKTGEKEEPTISMNHVHETWDGYRFYLASISPPDETAVKRIQLVINHDPGKYYLTYPGGFIVALGSLLLFAKIRRRRN